MIATMKEQWPGASPKIDQPPKELVAACEAANRYLRAEVFPAFEKAWNRLYDTCAAVQRKIETGESVTEGDVETIKKATSEGYSAIFNHYNAIYRHGGPLIAQLLELHKAHRVAHILQAGITASTEGTQSYMRQLEDLMEHGTRPILNIQRPSFDILLLEPEELIDEDVDIRNVISTVVSMNTEKAKRRGVTLVSAEDSHKLSPLRVRHIKGITFECLLEFIDNAMDATPKGGSIIVRCQQSGTLAEISITDTGKGINPHDLPHIFEDGFTTKDTGTGKGLYLAKRYFEDILSGSVTVASTPGKGTTITVKIPLAK